MVEKRVRGCHRKSVRENIHPTFSNYWFVFVLPDMHRKQKRHMAASISFCGNSERLCVCVCVIIECRASEKKFLILMAFSLSLSLLCIWVHSCVCVCCFVLSAISLIRSAFRTLLSRLRFKERKGIMCWRHSFLDVSREGTDFPSLNRHEEMK